MQKDLIMQQKSIFIFSDLNELPTSVITALLFCFYIIDYIYETITENIM